MQRLRSLSKGARTSLCMDAETIALAYHEQRARAPRRTNGYFSHARSGVTSSGDASRRTEEHLAIGLFLRGELCLPNTAPLRLLDYQFPLKSVRADIGIGKIDLLGRCHDGTLAVVELKVVGNREDRRIALLEALIYAAIVEANIEQIASEALVAKNASILHGRPKVLIVAPPDYWSDATLAPSFENFDLLTRAVARAIAIDISLLSLHDVDLTAYGLNGRPPQVQGHAFLATVGDDAGWLAAPRPVSRTSYHDDLRRRLWHYQRTSFATEDHLFDPRHSEATSPPVFRPTFAERNLLLPPETKSQTGAAISAMIPPIDRHRWFASMASSQALTQSVFGSLAALERLDALGGLAAEDGHPAFFAESAGYRLHLEYQARGLGEPRPTSLDVYLDGPRRVAVEVKLSEAAFGVCSRPRLLATDSRFQQDHCDGSFSIQRGRQTRCSLSERGILYWRFVPQVFIWSGTQDHRPCPLGATYQLVRNILAVCVGQDGTLDTDRGHVLVVYDRRNPAFQAGGDADKVWWATVRALRFPRLLRRVSWQSLAAHMARYPDLVWLTKALDAKFGIM